MNVLEEAYFLEMFVDVGEQRIGKGAELLGHRIIIDIYV